MSSEVRTTENHRGASSASGDELLRIAVEAYIFLYPLVNMDTWRRQMTNYEPGQRPGFGPMNMIHHMRAFPPGDLKTLARPNFDTLYSNFWLNLTAEPVIVSTPDTDGRMYLLPMLDMWTDAFAIPGSRSTGTTSGHFGVFDALNPAMRQALEQARAAARQAMKEKLPTLARNVNGWQMNTDTVGVYGNYYLKRAILTILGMGALPPEESIYPIVFTDADGEPLDGANDYVLHFDAHELPPADAFCSITLYDQDGFQVPNPLDRFALGDRDALRFSEDGSLDVRIRPESPGGEDGANWLPSAPGRFDPTMRLYHPRPEALDGRWEPPAVRRVS